MRYFKTLFEPTKAGEKKQLRLLEKLVNDVFAWNSAAGTQGKRAATIKEIMEMAKTILAVEGISEANLQVGDPYSVLPITSQTYRSLDSNSRDDQDDHRGSGSSNNRRSKEYERRPNNDRRGRSDRSDRSGAPRRDRGDASRSDIGKYCGKYNAGMPCQSGSCGRRHACNRYVDGRFCEGPHPASEHH